MKRSDPVRRPGRPLSFDRDAALRNAMLTFWRYGYESTSVADLTAAMGVSTPSLYTAFGDKKQLFLEAARLYAGDSQTLSAAVFAASTAHVAAHELMTAAAVAYTGVDTPRGCLLASATASGSAESADVQRAVADIRRDVQQCLKDRIELDVQNGMLPSDTDAAGLSGLVMAVMQGMSVLTRDGTDQADLLAIVRVAMQSWPRQSVA